MDPVKKISLVFGDNSRNGAKASPPSNGTKRPRAALHESDDEEAVEGQHQNITHFDSSAGGAVDSGKIIASSQLLVIPVPRKRQKSGLPNKKGEEDQTAALEAKAQAAAPITYGLNLSRNSTTDNAATIVDIGTVSGSAEPPKEKSIHDQAMDALLGNTMDTGATISITTEDEAFQMGYAEAPEAPTSADYDAVPIESFGAALLRGMGWKDGEAIGKSRGQPHVKNRVIERRPDLLGVGAKSAQAVGIELGEWGKVAKKHDKRLARAYQPVVLKNKVTGEMLTEEELKEKLREQEQVEARMVEVELRETKRLEYRSSKPSRRDDHERDHRRRADCRRDNNRDSEDRTHHSSSRGEKKAIDGRRRHQDRDNKHDDRDREEREKISSVNGGRRGDDDLRKRERNRRRRDRSSSSESEQKHRVRGSHDRNRKYGEESKSSYREYRRGTDR